MAKVTSKLQITIPKAIAKAHGIEPGDELEFESAGDVIRLHVLDAPAATSDLSERLAAFDGASARQADRDRKLRRRLAKTTSGGRGWRREDLYRRGVAR